MVPVLDRCFDDGVERDDAGVGDEHVYAPEVLDGRIDHPPRILHQRDVPDDGLDLSPGQSSLQLTETGLVHVGDHEARSLPRPGRAATTCVSTRITLLVHNLPSASVGRQMCRLTRNSDSNNMPPRVGRKGGDAWPKLPSNAGR